MAARRGHTFESAAIHLWWLVLGMMLPACVCDLPVHCEIEYVYGMWEFAYTGDQAASPLPVLPPAHREASDGNSTCDSGALGGGGMLTLELRKPNLVVEVLGSGQVSAQGAGEAARALPG